MFPCWGGPGSSSRWTPSRPARQQRRLGQVRVAGGVDAAVLEAAAAGDPDRAGAVLPAVVAVDGRPEAEVPHAAVGVDRRVPRHIRAPKWSSMPPRKCRADLRELGRAVGIVEDVVAVVVDQGEVVVVAVGRDPRERLRHERRQEAVLAADRGADLPVGGDVVGSAEGAVVAEVELELARRVLVVAVAHVEAQAPCRRRPRRGAPDAAPRTGGCGSSRAW